MEQQKNTIVCTANDLAEICAGLVKEGVIFIAAPYRKQRGYFLIELTGGF